MVTDYGGVSWRFDRSSIVMIIEVYYFLLLVT
jgi:hypothetical protein